MGSLIIVVGNMGRCKYASILTDHFQPYMQTVLPESGSNFQHDNETPEVQLELYAALDNYSSYYYGIPLL